ncbi:hypothetical protein R69927_01815 [Paraburkholderia domus]|jgi:hypothetical protein|uniref:Uncharacterized protein n=1 Tax=Paraburkholderia domus TaxID=2793075 RepID=A0A9N8MRL1_9BURK|nr:hypothetical protein [Paraburkholderia domus]MBK5048891.1 hypothetical protein [Burkholderia sp. R-70006]MBK5061398.1 hypothetical protein [Burkholderia sp. R-70199]MBK5086440.1 hypothetical protein [Burkholderia sp. R-69927]MBK5120280.1 hypothetical protein [Burkholderia sp. R-69980]MBK5165722.1 hypothetical protein [Burkholderia sp. R-70211]MBK5180005.1 hypothetical protein [Burkholderia sp. R-69749]MCI0147033.1 hypothetical protein [Paraburkholderia sediminicola]
MNTLNIHDLDKFVELDHEEMAEIQGGRMKLPGVSGGSILTSADGDPVGVYVDGVLQNSVVDGYYHG